MNYVRLGRTGLKVSEYCMGGDNFGGQMDEAESLRVMSAAFDGGVTFIDTANVYEEGRSEAYVGKFCKVGGTTSYWRRKETGDSAGVPTVAKLVASTRWMRLTTPCDA